MAIGIRQLRGERGREQSARRKVREKERGDARRVVRSAFGSVVDDSGEDES